MKARRLDINGSSGEASGRCSRSASGCHTPKFALSGLAVNASGAAVTASATVRNASERAGAAIPEFYVSGPNGANIPLRLVGWRENGFGARRRAEGDRRNRSTSACAAQFDEADRRWRIAPVASELTAGIRTRSKGRLPRNCELQSASLPP